MSSKITGKPDTEKNFEQMQKKEKVFTSVINTILVIIIAAVLMIILSILSMV